MKSKSVCVLNLKTESNTRNVQARITFDYANTSSVRTPNAVSRRKYKNQPGIAAEQTLKISISDADSDLDLDRETTESLISILSDSKLLSADNRETIRSSNMFSFDKIISIHFPILIPFIASLRSLASKVTYGFLTHEQGVVAANQLVLSGCTLSDCLALVGAHATYTLVDFLREVGLDQAIHDQVLERITDSRTIIDRLTLLNCIEEQTIRVASRLRYLISQGKITYQQALQIFAYYEQNKLEGETIIEQSIAVAA